MKALAETLQMPPAFSFAQDPEHLHQEQIPGRNADGRGAGEFLGWL
jgi:hypothetical protein